MKAEQIRDLNQDEILDKVGALKKELFTLRLEASTGKLEKNHRLKQIRRDVARFQTISNELRQGTEIPTPSKPKAVKTEAPAKPSKPKAQPAKAKAEEKPAEEKKGFFSKFKKKTPKKK